MYLKLNNYYYIILLIKILILMSENEKQKKLPMTDLNQSIINELSYLNKATIIFNGISIII